MRIKFTHSITERKRNGKVSVLQEMVVSVAYDPFEDEIHEPEVKIYQDGRLLGDFTKLFDEAKGDPLTAIIKEINWREVYQAQKELSEA